MKTLLAPILVSKWNLFQWTRRAGAYLLRAMLPLAIVAGCTATPDPEPVTFNAELAYLEAVTEAGPRVDPAAIFLMMAQYAGSSRELAGIARLESQLARYATTLDPAQQAVYLAAIGILRASHAGEIPLLRRIGWVEDTIATLERAKALSGGGEFLVHWAAGVTYARLPSRFEMEDTAIADLQWCLDHVERAPHPGWLREVHRHLAKVYATTGDTARSTAHLQQSGLPSLDHPILVTTFVSAGPESGATFFPRRLREVLPGRIYALSGFEFTEFYFIVSTDHRHLIAIDAGTRPDSVRGAQEYLRVMVPGLPPLTTVLVTHAHWDHVGGHRYLRETEDKVRFVARDNYQTELERIGGAPAPFQYFFGARFDPAAVADFRADVTVSARQRIVIGDTPIDIIPVDGGETEDALFFYLPQDRVLFVGDMVMPYLGAPFVEEGSSAGLISALDQLGSIGPAVILHGHEPLNRVFGEVQTLEDMRAAAAWLDTEIRRALREGAARPEIHRRNLIAPMVLQNPRVQVPFLLVREHMIDRIHDQTVGYWHPDLTGMDHVSASEWGAVLSRYLGVDESALEKAVHTMLSEGELEAAGKLVTWYSAYAPASQRVQTLRRAVFLKLAERFQEWDPFKYMIYSEQARFVTPQLHLP